MIKVEEIRRNIMLFGMFKNNKNKIKITPFEKELIENIENRGIIVENILQIDANDFNEEKLKINDTFSIPDKEEFLKKFGTNIEIFEYENKFSQLLGLVKKLEESERNFEKIRENHNNEETENTINYKIYDLQDNGEDGKKDYQLLRQEKISSNLELTMQKTKIYKVLELICNILENAKIISKNTENNNLNLKIENNLKGKKKFENIGFTQNSEYILKIRTKDLYEGFKSEDFLKVFNLKKSYDFFMEIVRQDYKYISRDEIFRIIKNHNKENVEEINIEIINLIYFIEEIEKIFEYKTLEEYGNYLENIFDKNGEKNKDVRDKYFEALSEMVVLENFSFDNLWNGFFNENGISASLLKLFLKYLDKKAISVNLEESDELDSENIAKYSINSSLSLLIIVS